jgi:hypothetical protein
MNIENPARMRVTRFDYPAVGAADERSVDGETEGLVNARSRC